ncbi:hypothetical protein SDC9_91463 [bioreactor metagenome]|uniref:Uncharacterized protein n=1 Tax=bioreactor metagenome TaxID=1076179 RepID=A0A644ZXW8_9ZZZZ
MRSRYYREYSSKVNIDFTNIFCIIICPKTFVFLSEIFFKNFIGGKYSVLGTHFRSQICQYHAIGYGQRFYSFAMILDRHVIGAGASYHTYDPECKIFCINALVQFSAEGNFHRIRYTEPCFTGFPQSGRFSTIDSGSKRIESAGSTCMAVAPYNDHFRAGMQSH